MTLAARKFIDYDENHQMILLRCKICGVVIGEKTFKTIGHRRLPDGRMVERVLESFRRNNLYCEIKFSFEDGSAHVTNGCKNCLMGISGDAARLEELEVCDMEEQGLKPRGSPVLEVVEVKIGGGIL